MGWRAQESPLCDDTEIALNDEDGSGQFRKNAVQCEAP